MTSNATQAIQRILSNTELPDGAGIRIESAGPPPSSNGGTAEAATLRMVIAAQAGGSDQVVEQEGARVFIDANLSDFLDDKLLDIATDGVDVQFTLGEQR